MVCISYNYNGISHRQAIIVVNPVHKDWMQIMYCIILMKHLPFKLKLSLLIYLGRVAPSAIGLYKNGPCTPLNGVMQSIPVRT